MIDLTPTKELISKARIMGLPVVDLTKYGQTITVAIFDYNIIILVDDNVFSLDDFDYYYMSNELRKLTGVMFYTQYKISEDGIGCDKNDIKSLYSMTIVGGNNLHDIDENMFRSLYMHKLDLSKLNVNKLTSLKSCFSGVTLDELNIDGWNTEIVNNMSSMFMNAKIGKVDMSNINTKNVRNMAFMFYGAYFNKLNISNFDTSKVEIMDNMFRESYIMSSLDLSRFNTQSAKSMISMFEWAKIFGDLDISSFETTTLTPTSGMLSYANIDGDIIVNDKGLINTLKQLKKLDKIRRTQ